MNLVHQFEYILDFLSFAWGQSIHAQFTNIWLIVQYQVAPPLDAFGSYQQAFGIIVPGYLTTLLSMFGILHLNRLVNWKRLCFQAYSTTCQ